MEYVHKKSTLTGAFFLCGVGLIGNGTADVAVDGPYFTFRGHYIFIAKKARSPQNIFRFKLYHRYSHLFIFLFHFYLPKFSL